MYKLQVIAPLQCAFISQHTLLSKKFVLMSPATQGLKLLTWPSFFVLYKSWRIELLSVLNYVILWSTYVLPIKSSESLYCAFGLIWDYFYWYNISVVLLLETKTWDFSGSEFTKIFLDLMHAITCFHLINSSSISSNKHVRSEKYRLLSHFSKNIHLGVKRLGRRNCVWLMKAKCSQTGWRIILTWGMSGWAVLVLEKIPTLLVCRWWRCLRQENAWGSQCPFSVGCPLLPLA